METENKHCAYRKVKKHGKVNSVFLTNMITCNRTQDDGTVENTLEINAESARELSENLKL